MTPERHDEMVAVGQPRPAPHRGQPDGRGRRRRRGARRPAAPGRRRVPRHDPHRQRPPGHLARHLRSRTAPPSSPALDAPDRRARRDARRSSARPTATASTSACNAGPRRPAATCPAASPGPSELAEVRIPIPDRPGAAAEIFTLAAELGVNIASFEVVHLAESNVGVAVVLVDAEVAELLPRRADRPRLPPGRHPPELIRSRAASDCRDRPLDAVVDVPGSKSIANRALVCAALADGDSRCSRRARRRRHRGHGRRASSALGIGGGRSRAIDAVVAAAVAGSSAPAAASRSTPAWPARRRGSSPPSPRSADGPVTVDGAAAAARPGRWRRCTTRWPRSAPGSCTPSRSGSPAGHGHRPAARGGDGRDRRRRLQPVPHRADARSARCSTAGCACELTTPLVSRPYVGLTAAGDGVVRCRRSTVVASDDRRRRRRRYRGRELADRARRVRRPATRWRWRRCRGGR